LPEGGGLTASLAPSVVSRRLCRDWVCTKAERGVKAMPAKKKAAKKAAKKKK
jgi:hypothetical protein